MNLKVLAARFASIYNEMLIASFMPSMKLIISKKAKKKKV